jgi:hypothetical protein
MTKSLSNEKVSFTPSFQNYFFPLWVILITICRTRYKMHWNRFNWYLTLFCGHYLILNHCHHYMFQWNPIYFQVHWPQVNNFGINFPPFEILLGFMFKSTAPKGDLKWQFHSSCRIVVIGVVAPCSRIGGYRCFKIWSIGTLNRKFQNTLPLPLPWFSVTIFLITNPNNLLQKHLWG